MGRWFRFYDDAINDPKILKLPEASRWHWTALLCIASKNDGVLPAIEDVALMLRVKPAAAAAIIAQMKSAGLLDLQDGKYAPHNWSGRQYKSDVSTERVKRFRKRERNVSETPPEAESEQIQSNADAVDAREPLVSREAQTLADELLVIAGHDLKFIPPGWCGAGMRVQAWLSQGWQREPILAAVKAAAARKRGPPASSVQFFEKAVAEEIARQSAPLPVVEIREAEKLTVKHGNTHVRSGNSLIAALDRKLAQLASEDGTDRALPESNILSLPNGSIR